MGNKISKSGSNSQAPLSSDSSQLVAPLHVPKSAHDRLPFIEAALLQVLPVELIGLIGSYANEILGGLYGPEAWEKCTNARVLDRGVPAAPKGDLSHRILLYIPLTVMVSGEEESLTLKIVKAVCGNFGHFCPKIEQQFGDETVAKGWVFLDTAVMAESLGKDEEAQDKLVAARECSKQHPIEAILLCRTVFAFTGVSLFGQGRSIYTCCNRKVDGESSVAVGFSDLGLMVHSRSSDRNNFGVAGARRISNTKSP